MILKCRNFFVKMARELVERLLPNFVIMKRINYFSPKGIHEYTLEYVVVGPFTERMEINKEEIKRQWNHLQATQDMNQELMMIY